MSDDIKARLRAVADATGPNEARDIAFEAADRIADLEAEVARLREALHAIIDADERGQGTPFADAMERAAALIAQEDR